MSDADDITQILADAAAEAPGAAERLIELVREDLRARASYQLRRSSTPATLEPTALVHEAYLRMFGQKEETPTWQNRGHFFFAASRAMQDILVDRARRATRIKRGGERSRVPLHADLAAVRDAERFLELHEVLARLEKLSELRASIVRLRFYCGIGTDEIAESLGLSRATIWREWTVTKLWLKERLGIDPRDLSCRTKF